MGRLSDDPKLRANQLQELDKGRLKRWPKRTQFQRFISKVRVEPSGCWIWTACCDFSGYGSFGHATARKMPAHKWAYEYFTASKVPADLIVCHHCDNPPCVNPVHLFVSTHQGNTDDKVAKGRQSKGREIPIAKLSDESVAEMRLRYRNGETFTDLGIAFGVSGQAARWAVTGRTWKHVPFPCKARSRSELAAGEKCPTAKLTKVAALEILRLHRGGEPTRELARRFGVVAKSIRNVLNGTTQFLTDEERRAA